MQLRAVKKFLIMFVLAIFISISIISFVRTPKKLDISKVAEGSQTYPFIYLIRHGERCDRSQKICLSEREGITVNGANKAQQYGNLFNKMFSSYDLYSTDTLRTIQTATFFQMGGQQPFPTYQLVMMTQ